MASALKQQIVEDMKTAMKAQEKERLGTIRLILAALKQREVDERIELDDTHVLVILDKMVKQRRDSIKQFTDAGRMELAEAEEAEIKVIEKYLPKQLSAAEIAHEVDAAFHHVKPAGMADMGKVMAILKPKLQGRADLAEVSKLVKNKLS